MEDEGGTRRYFSKNDIKQMFKLGEDGESEVLDLIRNTQCKAEKEMQQSEEEDEGKEESDSEDEYSEDEDDMKSKKKIKQEKQNDTEHEESKEKPEIIWEEKIETFGRLFRGVQDWILGVTRHDNMYKLRFEETDQDEDQDEEWNEKVNNENEDQDYLSEEEEGVRDGIIIENDCGSFLNESNNMSNHQIEEIHDDDKEYEFVTHRPSSTLSALEIEQYNFLLSEGMDIICHWWKIDNMDGGGGILPPFPPLIQTILHEHQVSDHQTETQQTLGIGITKLVEALDVCDESKVLHIILALLLTK